MWRMRAGRGKERKNYLKTGLSKIMDSLLKEIGNFNFSL